MALPSGAARSLDEKRVNVWKRKIIIILIILGFTACMFRIRMILEISKSNPDIRMNLEISKSNSNIELEEFIKELNFPETFLWDHIPVATPTQNCQFASTQGTRKYQMDHITCDLNLNISLFGPNGLEQVKVGAVAIFDGHTGMEASVMASRLFLDKFLHKLNYKQSFNYMELLKSSLVQTIEDIDSEFSKLAIEYATNSGTSAIVALKYNDHVLVANVGDSKAFLCSRKMQSHEAGEGTVSLGGVLAKELTRDHNALRLDERARVEAHGGVFRFLPKIVPFLMGQFSMTRAIGKVYYKRYGVIASPEVTDWLSLTSEDEYLVVAANGIVGRSTPQEVCEFVHEVEDHSHPSLLAQHLFQNALSKGCYHSLSVVLVPLKSPVA